MKNIVLFMLLSLVLPGAVNASADVAEECRQVISDKFPRIQAENITVSPEPHFCEIHTGNNILYMNPKQRFFLFGDLVDFDGRNLTAEARQRIVAEKVAALPLDNALRLGKGETQVIMFVDPDCPACRSVEKFLLSDEVLENLSVYIFLFPLEKIHPHAREHSLEILCADNPREKIQEFAQGKETESEQMAPDCLKDAGKRLDAMTEAGTAFKVRGTPTVIINNRVLGGNIIQIGNELMRSGAGHAAGHTGRATQNNPIPKE